MPSLVLLSGPNLNLLGDREPEIYGTTTLADLVAMSTAAAVEHGYELLHTQSNHEGTLVDAIHAARKNAAAIIINPGAFTHYSFAIADALSAFNGPIIELHLSNTHRREAWRHRSVVSPLATGIIMGLGAAGYPLAVAAAAKMIQENRT